MGEMKKLVGPSSPDGVKSELRSAFGDFLRRIKKNRAALLGGFIVLLLVATAILAPVVSPYSPIEKDMPRQLRVPDSRNLLGTDELGRDILSRIIWGSRMTLQVGIISVGIGLVIGVILGAISGYYGGLIDNMIMRMMDIMLAFPSILLAIAIMAILGPGLENAMIAVGIVAVPTYARLVRGLVLSVREMDYVEAAKAIGNIDIRVLLRHVLPNTLAPIIVQSTLGIGNAILEAAALGFLGLGAQRPFPEWGLMLSDGRNFIYNAPHVATFPGLAIMLTVLGFNLLGDGLRDALDPRLKS